MRLNNPSLILLLLPLLYLSTVNCTFPPNDAYNNKINGTPSRRITLRRNVNGNIVGANKKAGENDLFYVEDGNDGRQRMLNLCIEYPPDSHNKMLLSLRVSNATNNHHNYHHNFILTLRFSFLSPHL